MNGFSAWLRQIGTKLTISLRRFMEGRYGNDKLNSAILGSALVMVILALFIRNPLLNLILHGISYALMFWSIFRTLSRNTYKRYQENRKFSEALMQQLKTNSLVDPLSGAFDRRFLLDYLDESIRLVEAGELPGFSVLMFDLDHFKQINDRYGHLTGDECIRSLARLVRKNLRKDDALIRYGGEEFVCVLRGASDYTAVRRAEQIREKVSGSTLVPELTEPVTLSCGVVMYRPGMTPDDLIREADTQLYRAKRRGRDRVACRGSRVSDSN